MVKKNNFVIFSFWCLLFASVADSAEIKCNTAQMQAMDKITGHVNIIDVPLNTEVKFGTFSILVRDCQTRTPEETPENFAFVDIADYPINSEPVNIFKGWMLSSNPAINPVEHPIYDVWLLKCLNKDYDKTQTMSEEKLLARDSMKSIQRKNVVDDNYIEISMPEEPEEMTEPQTKENDFLQEENNVNVIDEEFVEFPISEEEQDSDVIEFSF